MKKILSIFIAAMLCAGLFTACGNSSPAAGEKLKIGIAQIMEHPSLNTIRESFMEEMAVLGYGEDKVTFTYSNAQGEQSNLNTIAQTFVGDEQDLIVAIATPTAQSMAAATDSIPILFAAVTDPVAAQLMTDMDAPDKNITGTSDAIPVNSIFQLAGQLTPNAKTFAFIYNLSEINSISVIEEAKTYCDANGLTYTEVTVSNTSEVQQAALSVVGKADAIFSPIDNTVATAMPTLAQAANEAGIPVYTGADSMVMDGGFATVGIDYTLLGQKTAQMAVELLEGKPVSQVPAVTMTNFRTIVNKDTAELINVDINGLENAEIYSAK